MKTFHICYLQQGVECLAEITAENEDQAWTYFIMDYGTNWVPLGIYEIYPPN